jgi:uncharacterized OB-fold protein
MGSTGKYEKFLPEGIPEWQMPFWDSLRRHDVRVQRCLVCGAYRYHPKEKCHRCASRQAEWAPISGNGEIYTYTVVRRAPTAAYAADVPYTLVHVTMAEGFRMVATLKGIEPELVRIGLPVALGYEDVTPDWTLLSFGPRDPPLAPVSNPAGSASG